MLEYLPIPPHMTTAEAQYRLHRLGRVVLKLFYRKKTQERVLVIKAGQALKPGLKARQD